MNTLFFLRNDKIKKKKGSGQTTAAGRSPSEPSGAQEKEKAPGVKISHACTIINTVIYISLIYYELKSNPTTKLLASLLLHSLIFKKILIYGRPKKKKENGGGKKITLIKFFSKVSLIFCLKIIIIFLYLFSFFYIFYLTIF